MRPIEVSDKLSVSAQPEIVDFAALKAQGFTAVINNRPDGEDPAQPGSAAEEAAARHAGLAYVHIPVTGTGMTPTDAQRFQAAIDTSPGRVLAHCRSGARAFYLWALGGALDTHSDQELLTLADKIGIDIKAVGAWLVQRRKQFHGGAL